MRYLGHKLALLVGASMFGAAAEAIAQSPVVLARSHPPVGESYISWLIQSLGFFGFMTLLAGATVFTGACLVVALARRPAVIASYLVFLFLPLVLSIIGALKGCVDSFAVVAISGTELKQSEIIAGLGETLLMPLIALTVTLPSYFVIAIGLFVRTLRADER